MSKLWERQPTETSTAYDAFCAYRDFGVSRSLEKTGQKLGKSKAIIERWSAQNNWVERATAYDDHIEALEREALEKERLAQRRKRLKISYAIQAKLVNAIGDIDLDKVKLADWVTAMAKINAEIRRDIGEEEPSQVQINNTVEVSTNDTRQQLLAKLRALQDD